MQFFKRRVYADAAASTPLSLSARKELVRLLDVYGNAGGLHEEGVSAKKEMAHARAKVASGLGAHPDEIIFTSGGTEGNNLALKGLLTPLLRERGELAAITSAIEHPSILEVFASLEEDGLYTVALMPDEKGIVSPKNLSESITAEAALVSIQLINSEVGTIQNIKEVAKVIRHARKEREANGNSLPLYFHTDASQAPLWIKLSVDSLGIDLMTLDGQKIMGPKGVGALYVRRGVKIEPVLQGGGQEKGLRSGTENVPLAGSFAQALHEAQTNAEKVSEKIAGVRDYLLAKIKKELPEAILNGGEGEARVANNINISIPGVQGEMIVIALSAKGVAASTRSACASEDEEPSHVLKALGVPPELSQSAVRITLLPDATKSDAEYILQALKLVVRRYRDVLK